MRKKITSLLLIIIMVLGITPVTAKAAVPQEEFDKAWGIIMNGQGDTRYLEEAYNTIATCAQNYIIDYAIENYDNVWLDTWHTELIGNGEYKSLPFRFVFTNDLRDVNERIAGDYLIEGQINYKNGKIIDGSFRSNLDMSGSFTKNPSVLTTDDIILLPLKSKGNIVGPYTKTSVDDIKFELFRDTINDVSYKDVLKDISSKLSHEYNNSVVHAMPFGDGSKISVTHYHSNSKAEFRAISYGPYNMLGIVADANFPNPGYTGLTADLYTYTVATKTLDVWRLGDNVLQTDNMYRDTPTQSSNILWEIAKINHRGRDMGTMAKPTAKNTITINANVDPYLELNLDKTQLDFNLSTLTDEVQDIVANVKSNMNYKIEAKFSGLNNADSTSTIGIDTFKLISNGIVKDLQLGAYSIIEDNKVFGDTNNPLSIKIENSKIIKSDTYTGTLDYKVSQL